MSNSDILLKGGKPWFSWGVLLGVATMAFFVAKIYFTVTSGQDDVIRRLATNEAAVNKAADTLEKMSDSITAMRYDLNAATGDLWSGTDMRLLWSKVELFWSEFARLNPAVQLPPWPPAIKAASHDGPGR